MALLDEAPGMYDQTTQLIQREQVAPGYHLLEFDCPQIAAAAQPGQFVHIRVTAKWDPLLRRPFSVMRTNKDQGSFQVLMRTVGRGTQMLAEAQSGTEFDILGPLGNGFTLPGPEGEVVLVAGGIGVAPLIFLATVLHEPNSYRYARGLFGARSEDDLCCWLELSGVCDEFTAVTEDGSAGDQGLVTDYLPPQLERGAGCVYACGPALMLAEVARQCQGAEVPCYVSMEQRMSCGVGACLGCVIPTHASGTQRYQRVCKDGPVFDAQIIDWEAIRYGCTPG